MTKNELRATMKMRNRAMCAEARLAAGEAIARQVAQEAAFVAARCVALFCALSDEPPTEAMLAGWMRQKRLVLPRVEGDVMHFYDYDLERLSVGRFGIVEPSAEAPLCDPAEIDLMVVPGVAFTRAGDRMGRGRGYYDRYLSDGRFRGVKVGVCYVHQIVEELPTELHDVQMDVVCAG